MTEPTLTTFERVPDGPRGLVRDVRLRWALEEAELPYSVRSTPSKDRGPEHFRHQPFGQLPRLTDGEASMFESGAMMLYLAERSEVPMPTGPKGRGDVMSWVDQRNGLDPFPQCRGSVARATARPAFAKAQADQLAHFAAALGRFTINTLA